jgi:hypothetical protein
VPKHHAIKHVWSGGTAPCILNLGTRWRWMVSFTPRPLYPREKSPWYPLDRRLGGPKGRFGRGGENKNSLPLPGIVQPVASHFNNRVIPFQISGATGCPEDFCDFPQLLLRISGLVQKRLLLDEPSEAHLLLWSSCFIWFLMACEIETKSVNNLQIDQESKYFIRNNHSPFIWD